MPSKKHNGHSTKIRMTTIGAMPRGMSEAEEKLFLMAAHHEHKGHTGPVGVSIPPSGLITTLPLTFEKAQKEVGGYVEVIRLPTGNIFLVDEEGLLKGYEINPVASMLARQPIVGTAVFVPKQYVKKVLG